MLVTVAVWAISAPWLGTHAGDNVMQLFGALALTGFGVTMVLSTRLPQVARLYGGGDKLPAVHKWTGVTSIGFVVVHLATRLIMFAQGEGMRQSGVHLPFSEAAATLFVLLAIFALWARKVNHKTWLLVHNLMAVAYLCALAHYYITSLLGPLGLSAFSIWMDVMALVGVASAIYSVLVVSRRSFKA